MGTHPIFESDFDCLTDLKLARNGQGTSKVKGGKGQSRLWRWKEIQKEVVQGKIARQAPEHVLVRQAHLWPRLEGGPQLQGHHSIHCLRSYEDPWLFGSSCHQGVARDGQDQVARPALITNGLHPCHRC